MSGNALLPSLYTATRVDRTYIPLGILLTLWPIRAALGPRSASTASALFTHSALYSARAGRYPMHGARSRLRQSANPRSDCKHGSGADARYILCPGDLMPQPQDSTLCTVDWVLVHVTTHAASTLTRTIWSSSYGSSADRSKAHIYLYFVDKAGCSTASLLTRWPRWGT